ncbi:MAG TPA: hypothetical protein PKG60_09355 [Spirochaetota bacterium]|nr:hypothetical protein [Spirochaetota bacterium]HPS87237.1 hypothetical protein [Spirochaetota bacterium]
MKKAGILTLFFVIFLSVNAVNAQEIREEESLNFTYLGPVLSYAYNKVEYTDWFETSTEKKEMSGYIYSGGLALNIFADNLCGDFQLKYAYNQLDFTMTYMEFSIAGKYFYSLNNYVSLGAGLGMYLETPPSNQEHNGSAGLQIPFTLLINTTPDSKLFIDIFSRYGSFGIGENTKSISAGVNVGFIFKVGRI